MSPRRLTPVLALVLSGTAFAQQEIDGPVPTRELKGPEGVRLLVDLSTQVLHCDVPIETGWGRTRGALEERIVPRASELVRKREAFAPAAVLGLKAKLFDDGLMAAVELAAQRGLGDFRSKQDLLASWARRVIADAGPVPQRGTLHLLGAVRSRRSRLAFPGEWQVEVARVLENFEKDELRSKPLGFYTWSGDLQGIFRQDRLLQTKVRAAEMGQLHAALTADADLRTAYDRWLVLAQDMTNPFVEPDLRSFDTAEVQGDRKLCVLPPSRSHETDLVKRLYANRSIPDGFDLSEELVSRLRAGELDLRPRRDSGWYDHQSWALAALATPESTPEAKHVVFSKRYTRELIGLMKSLLALTRETHVKQVEMPSVGAAAPSRVIEMYIHPELSSEPLVTHYLRRAASYAFVEQVLRRAFGDDGVQALRRQTETGPAAQPLMEELVSMQRLFHGAALAVAHDLGFSPGEIVPRAPRDDSMRDDFRSWVATMADDSDLQRDVRMMVPVFYDVERKRTKVWCLLGWTRKPLSVSFQKKPSWIRTSAGDSRVEVNVRFGSRRYELLYPVSAELYVDELLDREEFRALCDEHKTQQAILEALGS